MRIPHPSTRYLLSVILSALATLAVLLTACSPQTDLTDPTSGLPRLTTPDALMDEFAAVYQARDLDGYARILHEDFIFSFQACDVEKLGLSDDHYDRDDELASAARMFSGEVHVKSSGEQVAAIQSITFHHFERLDAWAYASDPGRPDMQRAIYEVDVTMDRGPAGTLSIKGRCVFFVRGDAEKGYSLVGWVDRTGGC